MTADDPRTARELDALDELAQVIHEQGYCGEVCACVDDARALLPVVDRIASERAAAELEAAADYWDRPTVRTVAADLRQRAIALRAVK